MKKKLTSKIIFIIVAIIVVVGGALYAKNLKNQSSIHKNGTEEDGSNGNVENETVADQDNLDTNIEENKNETTNSEIPMVELPDHITGMKAETAVNVELSEIIKEYYEIPEEDYDSTRYYYNYVDLDNDGSDEIFAVVMGSYTSGTGGSSALWLTEKAGKWHVQQDFTLINPPLIISDNMTNGVHDLVVPYYGGGAEGNYAILKYEDGEYTRVSDSETVKNLNNITGNAIIANDIPAERDAGIVAHSLLDE